MRRVLLAATIGLFSLVLLAPPAIAAEVQGNDPAGDVPYARGNITFFRAIHGSAKVDLRVRTLQGGQPVNTWPNRVTRIRWRLDTAPGGGPEYFADLHLARGVDTVFVGRIRNADTNALVPGCGAQQFVTGGDNEVWAQQNVYRYRFLRGCIGAPSSFRARATFIWDNGAANRGPVYTDYAPNRQATGPIASG